MKEKSWHINRRDFIRGGGAALALPFLNGMSWGKVAAGKGPAEAYGGELYRVRRLRTEKARTAHTTTGTGGPVKMTAH